MPTITKRKPKILEALPPESLEIEDLPTLSTPSPPTNPPSTSPLEFDEPIEELPSGVPITRQSLKLPPIPGEYLNWEQWDQYAKSLTPDHWAHLDMYVYRIDPVIDREPKYIDCLGEYKDLEYFVKTHGGGTYGLTLSDRALPQRQQKVCRVKLTIDKAKYDPILNYIELDLGDKRNRAYIVKLQNQGILNKDLEIVAMQPRGNDQFELVGKLTDKVIEMASDKSSRNNAPRDSGIENQAASAAIKMVSEVSQKLMEQQINQNDPLKQIEAMAKLVGIGAGNGGGGGTLELMKFMMESNNKMLQIMMDNNKASNERTEKLIEKMGTQPQGGGGSDMDKLDTFLTIAERLGGGGGSQSTLQTILGAVKEVIPHFAGPIMGMVMANKGYPVAQPGSVPQDPTTLLANPNPQAISPQVSPGVPPMESPTLTPMQIAEFISQFGGRITSAMERGDSGADLAQSLEMLLGYETYLKIRAVVEDKALLMEGVKLVPQFHTIIKGHGLEKFDEFIDSFVSWAKLRDLPEDAENGGIN
jgi:hypothetical protein